MSVNIITYTGMTRTALDDAVVFDAGVGNNGILYGCDITVSENTIIIGDGYGIIKGRLFEVEETEIAVLLEPTGTKYGFLNLRLDLSNSETPLAFNVVKSSTNSNPLEKEFDANFTDGVYEIELARFIVSTTELTDLEQTFVKVQGGVVIISESGTSLDDYTAPGTYYFDNTNTPVDVPGTMVNGWLVVLTDRAYTCKQLLLRQGSQTTQADVYLRVFTSGAWTSWRRLVTENEMYYMPGQQAPFRINCGGYLTSGGTYINGLVPLPKPVHSSVASATVVNNASYKITIRQNGKYLVNDVNTASLGTTCAVRANGLDINFTKSSGFGGTNNDVVSIVGYIMIQFN